MRKTTQKNPSVKVTKSKIREIIYVYINISSLRIGEKLIS